MGNCLKTQLKGVVNNDFLLKEDELPIYVENRSDYDNLDTSRKKFTFYHGSLTPWGKTYEANVAGVGYIGSSLESLNQKQMTFTRDNNLSNFYASNGLSVVKMPYKFNITQIALNTIPNYDTKSIFYINIDDLKYNNDLEEIELMRSNSKGDLSSFSNKTNLGLLAIGSTEIQGDISSLLSCSSLSAIDISKTKISGNISVFINNGALVIPLTRLTVNDTPNLTKNQADIDALTSLGVAVTV